MSTDGDELNGIDQLNEVKGGGPDYYLCSQVYFVSLIFGSIILFSLFNISTIE